MLHVFELKVALPSLYAGSRWMVLPCDAQTLVCGVLSPIIGKVSLGMMGNDGLLGVWFKAWCGICSILAGRLYFYFHFFFPSVSHLDFPLFFSVSFSSSKYYIPQFTPKNLSVSSPETSDCPDTELNYYKVINLMGVKTLCLSLPGRIVFQLCIILCTRWILNFI